MIRCYCGLLGAGKTYAMVEDAVTHLREKKQMVFTNMAGLRFPEAVYYGNVTGLLELREGLVLFDEVGVALNSRFWSDVPRDIISRFSQSRKHGLDLFYTAQYMDQADRTLKDVTNEWVHNRRLSSRFVQRRTSYPGESETQQAKNLPTYTRFRPEIFWIYDTLELISTKGGSEGRATFPAPESLLVRQRSGDKQATGAGSLVPPRPLTVTLFGEERPSDYARGVGQWLKDRGRLDCDTPVQTLVAEEVRRRQWLALFGLTWQQVPDDCTYDNPWHQGYDPASVKAREYEAALELQADQLAMKASTRGRKLAMAG